VLVARKVWLGFCSALLLIAADCLRVGAQSVEFRTTQKRITRAVLLGVAFPRIPPGGGKYGLHAGRRERCGADGSHQ
jgi:hypothetical protein